MPTPHNTADKSMIAKTVLMPGDPLRAKFIADNFLDNVKMVNEIRNMLAFTGVYKGRNVTVMGSGMGIPSIGIYSYELFNFYDVDEIIRVGSAISYSKEIGLYDIVLGTGACSDSTYAKEQSGFDGDFVEPGQLLVDKLRASAVKLECYVHEGTIHSSDVFYYATDFKPNHALHQKYQVVCGEMESYALFHNAHESGKQAATILTMSDTIFSKEEVSAKERETSFVQMMEIALGVLS